MKKRLNAMPLDLFGNQHTIYGGPYKAKPNDMFGVKMAEEIDAPCDVDVPTRDFSIPEINTLTVGLLEVIDHLNSEDNREVYVGCYGGIGRTGLFLSCLQLVALSQPRISFGRGYFWKRGNGEDAIDHVRKTYFAGAVETRDQKLLINSLILTDISKYAYATRKK